MKVCCSLGAAPYLIGIDKCFPSLRFFRRCPEILNISYIHFRRVLNHTSTRISLERRLYKVVSFVEETENGIINPSKYFLSALDYTDTFLATGILIGVWSSISLKMMLNFQVYVLNFKNIEETFPSPSVQTISCGLHFPQKFPSPFPGMIKSSEVVNSGEKKLATPCFTLSECLSLAIFSHFSNSLFPFWLTPLYWL